MGRKKRVLNRNQTITGMLNQLEQNVQTYDHNLQIAYKYMTVNRYASQRKGGNFKDIHELGNYTESVIAAVEGCNKQAIARAMMTVPDTEDDEQAVRDWVRTTGRELTDLKYINQAFATHFEKCGVFYDTFARAKVLDLIQENVDEYEATLEDEELPTREYLMFMLMFDGLKTQHETIDTLYDYATTFAEVTKACKGFDSTSTQANYLIKLMLKERTEGGRS